MIENVLKTYSFEQLVDIAYPVKKADWWMNHSHKGDFAKAVKGDENCFVDPKKLSSEELERARAYFIEKYKKFYDSPAYNR